jgi:hypothetical protein
LAASDQVEGLLPRLLQIGEHANGLREVDQRPALDESPLALILHKQTPDPFISALSGKNGVLRFGDLFRQDDERYGGRRVSECGVRFVGRRASDGDRSGILHVNGDVALRSERGRVFPTPAAFDLCGFWQARQVDCTSDKRENIPEHHRSDQAWNPPGWHQPQQTEKHGHKKTWTEAERNPAKRLRVAGDLGGHEWL